MSRQDLIDAARLQLGLSNIAPVDWSYSQRIEYNKLLASLIEQNASNFPPQEVAIARDISAKVYDPLSDLSALDDLRTFGNEFANQLLATGDAVADIGRGVRDAASFVGNAAPYITALALLGVALYLVIKYDPRRNGIEK
jgi:hypothetical protein